MASNSQADPFDTLLTLEDTLYSDAYALGCADGARAGRIEGRIFGLEQGFEKFAAMGALHGRACVWGSRVSKTLNEKEKEKNRKGNSRTSDLVESESEETRDGNATEDIQNTHENDVDVGKENEDENAIVALHNINPVQNQNQLQHTHNPQQTKNQTTEPSKKLSVALPSLPANPRLEKNISTLYALTDPLTFDTANSEEAVADFDDRFKRASAKAKIIERIIGEGVGAASPDQPQETAEKGTKSPKKGQMRGGIKLSGESKKKNDDSMEDFSGSRLLR
jgi:hypothetical protein